MLGPFWVANIGLAAVNVDCNRATAQCVGLVSVVNSRWFAIGLAWDLSKALLFDFGHDGGSNRR
jgi:hypothetical protein